MKLVEIAGHLIDPGKVSYVGPVYDRTRNTGRSYLSVVVDGWEVDWNFDAVLSAIAARQSLIAAIESAQLEMTELEVTDPGMPLSCCVSWSKHPLQPNEKGEHLWGECWPKHGKDDIAPFPSDPPFSDYKPFDELTKAVEAEVAEAKEALDMRQRLEEALDDILAESDQLPLMAPLPGDNGAMGASDALVGVEP